MRVCRERVYRVCLASLRAPPVSPSLCVCGASVCWQNAATKKLEQARTEGLREISRALQWEASTDVKYLMSLDYIFKLVESSGDPESKLETFLGLPADLRTVATATTP